MRTRDARRRLVGGSERSQYYYDETHYYARDTERYRAECERLLGRRSEDSRGHGRVKDRAQRMAENGEALKYIELVLRQLRRASRDHRDLMRQRHADFQYEMSKRINERVCYHHREYRPTDGRVDDSTTNASRSSSSGFPWESDLTLRKSRPDVTTRLLTKRRDYGGTAQSTLDTPRPVPDRVQAGLAAYRHMRYTRDESVGWNEARQTLGAWSLSEASPSNDRRTSSTVV